MRRGNGRLLWILFSAWASSAQALPPLKPALHWVRAPGAGQCIDGRALARKVEDITGPLFVPAAEAERSLEGFITPEGTGFRVRIASVTEQGRVEGERSLTTRQRDCRSLDMAIAFVIALTLDPEVSLADLPPELLRSFGQEEPAEQRLLAELAQQPAKATPTAAPAFVAPPAAPLTPPAPPPPAPQRSRFAVSVGASALARTLPGWAFGVQSAFVIDPPRVFPISVVARLFPRSPTQVVAGGHARFSAYQVMAGMCPLALRNGRLRTLGCVGPELAVLQATGIDFDLNQRARLLDAAVSGTLSLSLALRAGFGIFAEAFGRLRLTGQEFAFEPAVGATSASFAPPRLGGGASTGLNFEF